MKRLYRNYSVGCEQSDLKSTISSIRSISKNMLIYYLKSLLQNSNLSLVVYGEKISTKQKKEIKQLMWG